MTPTELRETITAMGLSQVSAAKGIGVSPRNMRRYCSGELPVPLTVELALEGLKARRSNETTDTPK